jgi:hypothetical protein
VLCRSVKSELKDDIRYGDLRWTLNLISTAETVVVHQLPGIQLYIHIMLIIWRLVRAKVTLSVASQSRRLHLAPPFLLDDYIPRYQILSAVEAAKKRSAAYAHLRNCNLCPRLCGINRYEKTGFCLIGAETVKVNVIAPHFGGK